MNDLQQEAEQLGILDQITFLGFVQTQEVSKVLACGYALILPSVEEQFGNVVIEAQALGLPVLLTHGCGAADGLMRSFVNGFIFEDDNPNGLAGFMGLLDQNKSLYHDLSHAAFEGAEKGDVAQFAKGVEALLIESGRK